MRDDFPGQQEWARKDLLQSEMQGQGWASVIRTDRSRKGFLAFCRLLQSCEKTDDIDPQGREPGDLFKDSSSMDQTEINHWQTIAESMEAKGDTESWFYLRARAIADGKPDPMPNVSELMGGSAAQPS